MSPDKAHLYLIPGFFGFADMGGIAYFHHVDGILRDLLHERGIEPEIHYVKTSPTASLRYRARCVYAMIAATAAADAHPIHLIGHSTGGLDARLFVSPGVDLDDDDDEELDVERFAARCLSVVSVATPHRGTPLAFFFNSLLGEKLLYLLSLATIYALRFGQFPLAAVFSVLGIVARLDDRLGWQNTILDQFYDKVFAEFDDDDVEAINAFLEEIKQDQTLLGQLTPGSGDLFNAIASDRPDVDYGCVITRSARPRLKTVADIGFNAYEQASHVVYRLIYFLTSLGPSYPAPRKEQMAALRRVFGSGRPLDDKDSDGVVPTLAQIWGEVIHCCYADHLDVCGHFSEKRHNPPHIDWLASGTGFRREDFEELWTDVAEFVASSQQRRS